MGPGRDRYPALISHISPHKGDRVRPVPVEIRTMDTKPNLDDLFDNLPEGLIEDLQYIDDEYLSSHMPDESDDPDPFVDRVIW